MTRSTEKWHGALEALPKKSTEPSVPPSVLPMRSLSVSNYRTLVRSDHHWYVKVCMILASRYLDYQTLAQYWFSYAHASLDYLASPTASIPSIQWILVSDKVLKDQNILRILRPGSQNLSINFRQRSGADSYLFQHVLLQHLLPATAAAAATPPVTWDTRATCRRSKIDWLAYKC